MFSKFLIKALFAALFLLNTVVAFAYDGVRLQSSNLVTTHTATFLKKKFKENHIPSFIIKIKYEWNNK